MSCAGACVSLVRGIRRSGGAIRNLLKSRSLTAGASSDARNRAWLTSDGNRLRKIAETLGEGDPSGMNSGGSGNGATITMARSTRSPFSGAVAGPPNNAY